MCGQRVAGVNVPRVPGIKLDNPIEIPDVLSLSTYKRWNATVRSLNSFPRDT